MKKAAGIAVIAPMLLSLLPFSAYADSPDLHCPMKHLGLSDDTIHRLYSKISAIPQFVYLAVFIVLVLLWVFEMVRRDGSLHIKKVLTKQPQSLFFELGFFFTYNCTFAVSRGRTELFQDFFASLGDGSVFAKMFSDDARYYIVPFAMFLFLGLWLIFELFGGSLSTLFQRLTFKIAVLSSAVIVTLFGTAGTVLVYLLIDVRIIMYATFIIYNIASLFDLTLLYRKLPSFVSAYFIRVSNGVSRGNGRNRLRHAIAKRYGTQAAAAFFEIDNHRERVLFLDELKKISS